MKELPLIAVSPLFIYYLKHKNHKRQADALCLWSGVSSPHSQLSIFNSQLINDFRIRSIYHVVFDALEVYLSRGLGTMSHAGTDDRDGGRHVSSLP